jgi:hypothetical protein
MLRLPLQDSLSPHRAKVPMYTFLPLSQLKPSHTHRPFNCFFTALLSLANTILPEHVELVNFTNVELRCLQRLAPNYRKDEFSVRVGQLVITSPSWKALMLEAYGLSRPSVKKVLGEIALPSVSDEMAFNVCWHDSSDDNS